MYVVLCLLLLLLLLSQDVHKYKLGLYFALRFYLTMQQQQQAPSKPIGSSSSGGGGSVVAGLAPRPSVGGFARSEGIGAEPQQLEQWLLSLVLGYAAATLSEVAAAAAAATAASIAVPNAAKGSSNSSNPDGTQTHDSSSDGVPAPVAAAAETCVCACLLLGRPDVLFGRVFQLFAQQGSVSGGLGALLEVVELAVLSDLLQGLAPEVMQVRLVQTCYILTAP
jgi:hypothetical protein